MMIRSRRPASPSCSRAPRDAVGVVVRGSLAAAQDHVAVWIALRVEDRRGAADVNAGEGVRAGGRSDGVDGQLDAAGGAVLEADRHREARGELPVDLALGGAGADRPPGDHVGDVLRRDRVEELTADCESQIRHLEQQPAGGVKPDVHVPRPVQVRVIDQALPARRRARLLEVGAHGDAEVALQILGSRAEALRVVHGRLGVMDAARSDHDEQAVVIAVQHRLDLGSMAEDGVLSLRPQ